MKNKQLISITMTLMLFMAASLSWSQEIIRAKEITLGDFTGIEVSGTLGYVLKQGASPMIRYETLSNDEEVLVTEIKDGILKITARGGPGEFNGDIVIVYKELSEIKSSGAVEIKSSDVVKASAFKIIASGSSDITLALDVADLQTPASGASSIVLSGRANVHKAQFSGASTLKAHDLVTDNTDIVLTGASDASVDAVKELTAKVSGASDLRYKSRPEILNVENSGTADSGPMDTTRFKVGDKNIIIVEDKEIRIEGDDGCDKDKGDWKPGKKHKDRVRLHWAGVNLGINGFLNSNNELKTPVGFSYLEPDYARSWFVDINPFEVGIPILKKHINIVSGLGMTVNNYRFDNNYILQPNTDYTSAVEDTAIMYSKNKLTTVYLTAPLLLQFDTPRLHKKNTIHLSLGVVGGVRIGSHTKQVYEIDNTKFKPKTRDDFNLAPFRYSAMVKIGYGPFNVFATYQVSELFRKNKGPQMHPFSVGVTVAGW